MGSGEFKKVYFYVEIFEILERSLKAEGTSNFFIQSFTNSIFQSRKDPDGKMQMDGFDNSRLFEDQQISKNITVS